MSERSINSILDDDEDDELFSNMRMFEDSSEDEDEDEDDESPFSEKHDKSDNTPWRERQEVRRSQPERAGSPHSNRPQGAHQQQSSRITQYKAVQAFIQSFAEAAPLYIAAKARAEHSASNELMSDVASLSSSHFKLIELCLELNDADPNDLMLRYQRRQVSKLLAELYQQVPIEDMEELVRFAHQIQQTQKDQSDDGSSKYQLTQETLLCAKWIMFNSSMQIISDLKLLFQTSIPVYIYREIQETSLSLAKEVSYAWSTKSESSEINSIFFNILPHVVNVVFTTYKEMLLEELDDPDYLISDPEMNLPLFEKSLSDMDMGYSGENKENLLRRLRLIAKAEMAKTSLNVATPDQIRKLNSARMARIDTLMSECWEESCNELLSSISSMSIEDREAFAKNNTVMDLSSFLAELNNQLQDMESPLEDIDVDSDDLKERSRRNLTWVWGLANSLSNTRTNLQNR